MCWNNTSSSMAEMRQAARADHDMTLPSQGKPKRPRLDSTSGQAQTVALEPSAWAPPSPSPAAQQAGQLLWGAPCLPQGPVVESKQEDSPPSPPLPHPESPLPLAFLAESGSFFNAAGSGPAQLADRLAGQPLLVPAPQLAGRVSGPAAPPSAQTLQAPAAPAPAAAVASPAAGSQGQKEPDTNSQMTAVMGAAVRLLVGLQGRVDACEGWRSQSEPQVQAMQASMAKLAGVVAKLHRNTNTVLAQHHCTLKMLCQSHNNDAGGEAPCAAPAPAPALDTQHHLLVLAGQLSQEVAGLHQALEDEVANRQALQMRLDALEAALMSRP